MFYICNEQTVNECLTEKGDPTDSFIRETQMVLQCNIPTNSQSCNDMELVNCMGREIDNKGTGMARVNLIESNQVYKLHVRSIMDMYTTLAIIAVIDKLIAMATNSLLQAAVASIKRNAHAHHAKIINQ